MGLAGEAGFELDFVETAQVLVGGEGGERDELRRAEECERPRAARPLPSCRGAARAPSRRPRGRRRTNQNKNTRAPAGTVL